MIKKKVAALATALTTVGGLAAVAAQPASASTPQCVQTQGNCTEIFSKAFGTPASPGFVETVFGGIPAAGVPTLLRPLSTTSPAGDFIPHTSTVHNFYTEGMVSAAVDAHYDMEPATQVEYAPFGHPTGLCAAIATARPYTDEGLTLESCKIPGQTVFIIDIHDSSAPGYFPLVIGATTDFTHPFAMTFEGRNDPAHTAWPAIRVAHLIGNPTAVPDRQLWDAVPAPASS
jgi:hypothetical protein